LKGARGEHPLSRWFYWRRKFYGMQIRESLKNNGNTNRETFFAISASMAFHICIALILVTSTAVSTRLKFEDDQIVHVSLVSMDTGQKSQSREMQDLIKEKNHSKYREAIDAPQAVVNPIEKKERVQLPVDTASHPVAEMQPIKPTFDAIRESASSGTKDVTILFGHKGQNDSVTFGNTSIGELSLAVPRYRENPHPVYPMIARIRGYEGVVLISAEVLADGRVGYVKLKKSSGYSVLDQSALNAVRKWIFEPARKMNTPLSTYVDIPLRFSLNDNN